MGSRLRAGVATARSGRQLGKFACSPSIDPLHAESVDTGDGNSHRFPEIDCIRRALPDDVLGAAEQRATTLGVGVDRVLVAAGVVDEETYLRALGETLRVAFEPLDRIPRTQCPVNDERLIEFAATGLLPLALDDGLTLVVAPRGTAARRILHLIEENPARATRFRLTSAEHFNSFVLLNTGNAIAARASETLRQIWPMLSAAPQRRRSDSVSMASFGMLSLAAIIVAPVVTVPAFELMLAMVFLAWFALRLIGAFIGRPAPDPSTGLPDDTLPVYTVISALYRESSSVDGLLSAIERLDYPPEKLDVIIAVEADDHETRAALAARRTRMPIAVIPVPAAGPRTKPKALNVALPFARGTFTVVYDAEDRPEPNQLRCALQAFLAADDDLACVQARLSIDNTADSWLARYYTAEYASHFDVFLPGLTALGLPLPLGGSSNHFRTATLREVRGWDPYNVTEDADLGMRLERFGYRSDMIDSTTYEEAPAYIGPWLRQRTRWFKGWMRPVKQI